MVHFPTSLGTSSGHVSQWSADITSYLKALQRPTLGHLYNFAILIETIGLIGKQYGYTILINIKVWSTLSGNQSHCPFYVLWFFVPVSNLFWFFVLLSVFYSFFLPVTPITRLARPRSESAPGNFLKFSEKS